MYEFLLFDVHIEEFDVLRGFDDLFGEFHEFRGFKDIIELEEL